MNCGHLSSIKATKPGLGAETSQLGNHPPDHGQIDEGLTAGVGPLKIAGEPTVTRDPAKGSFHHPSFGKHVEAFGDDRVPVDVRPFRNPDPLSSIDFLG
jgi:hypothetical protein